jgi:hypothetical protein
MEPAKVRRNYNTDDENDEAVELCVRNEGLGEELLFSLLLASAVMHRGRRELKRRAARM